MFSASGIELGTVNTFKCLGRPLSSSDSDWPALRRALTKSRGRWARFSRLLRAEGARPRQAGMFYKAVVQAVLLFGSETWVRTQTMDKLLSGFHHRVARRLSGHMPRLHNGVWVYPPH